MMKRIGDSYKDVETRRRGIDSIFFRSCLGLWKQGETSSGCPVRYLLQAALGKH